MDEKLIFPKNFIWGAATAAFQVEGGREDRGDSVWDAFCKVNGAIKDGSDGSVACDHYHRYKDDLNLLTDIGVDAYRFSVSWPRLCKNGSRNVNVKGLDFYNKLIDGLLEKNVTPFLTLYHWDLPVELHEKGGWLNPDMPKYFYDYAYTVGSFFGDRVKNFITFNEPQCFIPYGYRLGIHAPGFKVNDKELLFAIHNVLRAHGMAVNALRQSAKDCKIGITMAADADYPLTDSAEDIEAARKEIMSLKPGKDNWMTNIIHWNDPIYFGKYPEESYSRFGADMPEMTAEDSKLISTPIDFHGQNCYSGSPVRSDGKGGYEMAKFPLGSAKNSLNWGVTPRAIWFVTKSLYERYRKPIYITENGICCNDWIHEDGAVHDADRVDFMKKYLKMLNRSISEGVDVRGYFAWSLMDNFEWADGYTERFGLVYVDYETQKRTLKDSALFYRDLIKVNRERRF